MPEHNPPKPEIIDNNSQKPYYLLTRNQNESLLYSPEAQAHYALLLHNDQGKPFASVQNRMFGFYARTPDELPLEETKLDLNQAQNELERLDEKEAAWFGQRLPQWMARQTASMAASLEDGYEDTLSPDEQSRLAEQINHFSGDPPERAAHDKQKSWQRTPEAIHGRER